MRTEEPSGVRGGEARSSCRASGGTDTLVSDFQLHNWERRRFWSVKLPRWWPLVITAPETQAGCLLPCLWGHHGFWGLRPPGLLTLPLCQRLDSLSMARASPRCSLGLLQNLPRRRINSFPELEPC